MRFPRKGEVLLVKMPPWIEVEVIERGRPQDGRGAFFVRYLEGRWKGERVRLFMRDEGRVWCMRRRRSR